VIPCQALDFFRGAPDEETRIPPACGRRGLRYLSDLTDTEWAMNPLAKRGA